MPSVARQTSTPKTTATTTRTAPAKADLNNRQAFRALLEKKLPATTWGDKNHIEVDEAATLIAQAKKNIAASKNPAGEKAFYAQLLLGTSSRGITYDGMAQNAVNTFLKTLGKQPSVSAKDQKARNAFDAKWQKIDQTLVELDKMLKLIDLAKKNIAGADNKAEAKKYYLAEFSNFYTRDVDSDSNGRKQLGFFIADLKK